MLLEKNKNEMGCFTMCFDKIFMIQCKEMDIISTQGSIKDLFSWKTLKDCDIWETSSYRYRLMDAIDTMFLRSNNIEFQKVYVEFMCLVVYNSRFLHDSIPLDRILCRIEHMLIIDKDPLLKILYSVPKECGYFIHDWIPLFNSMNTNTSQAATFEKYVNKLVNEIKHQESICWCSYRCCEVARQLAEDMISGVESKQLDQEQFTSLYSTLHGITSDIKELSLGHVKYNRMRSLALTLTVKDIVCNIVDQLDCVSGTEQHIEKHKAHIEKMVPDAAKNLYTLCTNKVFLPGKQPFVDDYETMRKTIKKRLTVDYGTVYSISMDEKLFYG